MDLISAFVFQLPMPADSSDEGTFLMKALKMVSLSFSVISLLLCGACGSQTIQPGRFSLDVSKSTFLSSVPPDMKLKLSLSEDGSFEILPFEERGTWAQSGSELKLTLTRPSALFNSLEGKAFEDTESLTTSWKVLSNDGLSWKPKSFSEERPLVFVFVRD